MHKQFKGLFRTMLADGYFLEVGGDRIPHAMVTLVGVLALIGRCNRFALTLSRVMSMNSFE